MIPVWMRYVIMGAALAAWAWFAVWGFVACNDIAFTGKCRSPFTLWWREP